MRLVLGQSGYHRKAVGNENRPRQETPLAIIGEDPRPYLYRFLALVRNTPILEQAASSSAVFHLVPGNDGVVRSVPAFLVAEGQIVRSEEHTSELQSLMRISYAVFCLKHKKKIQPC